MASQTKPPPAKKAAKKSQNPAQKAQPATQKDQPASQNKPAAEVPAAPEQNLPAAAQAPESQVAASNPPSTHNAAPAPPQEVRRIIVRGLPMDVTKEELNELANPCGRITDVKLVPVNPADVTRRGFVTFLTQRDAEYALYYFEDKQYRGKHIKVALAPIQNKIKSTPNPIRKAEDTDKPKRVRKEVGSLRFLTPRNPATEALAVANAAPLPNYVNSGFVPPVHLPPVSQAPVVSQHEQTHDETQGQGPKKGNYRARGHRGPQNNKQVPLHHVDDTVAHPTSEEGWVTQKAPKRDQVETQAFHENDQGRGGRGGRGRGRGGRGRGGRGRGGRGRGGEHHYVEKDHHQAEYQEVPQVNVAPPAEVQPAGTGASADHPNQGKPKGQKKPQGKSPKPHPEPHHAEGEQHHKPHQGKSPKPHPEPQQHHGVQPQGQKQHQVAQHPGGQQQGQKKRPNPQKKPNETSTQVRHEPAEHQADPHPKGGPKPKKTQQHPEPTGEISEYHITVSQIGTKEVKNDFKIPADKYASFMTAIQAFLAPAPVTNGH